MFYKKTLKAYWSVFNNGYSGEQRIMVRNTLNPGQVQASNLIL